MRTRLLFSAAMTALALTATAADAQMTPHGRNQVISIQPLSAMLTVYSAEVERAFSPSVTLGLGGTYWGAEENETDVSYTSGDLKLRYYPSGRALDGFSFGVSGGWTRVAEQAGGSASGPTIGTMIDYSWLLNDRNSFYIGLGAGAKALFIDEDDLEENVTVRYPTVRFSVGWAF